MKKIMRASLLITVCLFLFLFQAEGQDKPVEISLESIKTELEEQAIGLGIQYVESLDSMFTHQDILLAQDNSLFQLTPAFDVQTGTGDAFSSISAKISGIFMTFRDTTIAGQITPNTSRGFQTFPLSVGIETNGNFSILNGIAEIGWVPWYQTVGNKKIPELLKRTKLGVFLQGGYKFGIDTTGFVPVGGEIDESKEQINEGIGRVKGSFGIDTRSLLNFKDIGIGIVGNLHGWYDFVNGELYHLIEANFRFYPSNNRDKYFTFEYQNGSGAPNFNKGDQFGMGLTVTL